MNLGVRDKVYTFFCFFEPPPASLPTVRTIIMIIFQPHINETIKIPKAPAFTRYVFDLFTTVLYTNGGPTMSRQNKNNNANTKSFTVAKRLSFMFNSRSIVRRCKLGLLTSIRNRHPTSSGPLRPVTTPLASPPSVNM